MRLIKLIGVSCCLLLTGAFLPHSSVRNFQSRSLSSMPEDSIVPAAHQKVYLDQVTRPKMTESMLSRGIGGEKESKAESKKRNKVVTEARKLAIIKQATEVERNGRMPVILNGEYGGFGFSEDAINLYKELYEKKHGAPFSGFEKVDEMAYRKEEEDPRFRTDALMAKIVENNPRNASGFTAGLTVHYTDKRYKGYIDLTTYDGADSAKFIRSLYVMDRIKEIERAMELSEREKVQQIHAVLHEPLEPFWVSYGLWHNQWRV